MRLSNGKQVFAMNNPREEIFSTIRRNKMRDASGSNIDRVHTVPRRALLPDKETLALFEKMVLESAATIEHINSPADLPDAVSQYLMGAGLREKRHIYLNSPLLVNMNWEPVREKLALGISGEVDSFDSDISITSAFCGIAETGSVVLLSDPAMSSAAYFLPRILIVMLARDQVLQTQESCWQKIRSVYNNLPRTVTFVTGPSRTGDIEQKLIIGAHGPVKVHVVICDHRSSPDYT